MVNNKHNKQFEAQNSSSLSIRHLVVLRFRHISRTWQCLSFQPAVKTPLLRLWVLVQYVFPMLRWIPAKLHGVTFQKTVILIVTAVRTSDDSQNCLFLWPLKRALCIRGTKLSLSHNVRIELFLACLMMFRRKVDVFMMFTVKTRRTYMLLL
jgi:hypothetical protein